MRRLDFEDMTLDELYANEDFIKEFIKPYISDLPKMIIELFRKYPSHQQEEVLYVHSFLQGRTVVPSGHGTGKTALIGMIATCFILLFPYSIIRIQAPQLKQVTSFSFKEITENLKLLGEEYLDKYGNVVKGRWAFLANKFTTNIKKIYLTSNQTDWYIEATTAPIGKSENLSGQHKWAYLLIFDEMSGIPDSHIKASLGALTEEVNSCIGFSQHTRLLGSFHDFVTISKEWNVVRLSSELSPFVSTKAIMQMRESYSENEYKVRVLGEAPAYVNGNLITPQEAADAFNREVLGEWVKSFSSKNLIISIDVAYRGIRNNSVITTLEVSDDLKKVIVKTIEVTTLKPLATVNHAFPHILKMLRSEKYDRIVIGLDATAGGAEASEELERLIDEVENDTLIFIPIIWGSFRLMGIDRGMYKNQRAKAYATLQGLMMDKRLLIEDRSHETRARKELSNIPFKYVGDDFLLKIASKDEMEIESPDIADTLAMGVLMIEELEE